MMRVCFLFFCFACLTTEMENSELKRQNSILLDVLDKLTDNVDDKVDDFIMNRRDIDPQEDLGPAAHCMDLNKLEVSFDFINQEIPCLYETCASIKTAEECRSEINYKHGCSWCAGSCVPYYSYNQAFVDCVREAYATEDPDKVNGKVPPGEPSASEYDKEWTNVGYATEQQNSHPYYGRLRWSDNENKRKPGERVPIHVHPFPGLSCITTYDAEPSIIWAEGEEPFELASGTCYSMPPMKKLGPQSPGGYTVRDTFVYDVCYPVWVVIEPGSEQVQDNQFKFESDLTCSTEKLFRKG